jgi:hypothetical protein
MSHIAEVRMSVASPYRTTFRQALAAGALLMASVASQAVTVDKLSYTLMYDDQTLFGDPVFTSGPGGQVSFSWVIPNSVSAVSIGGAPVTNTFTLPSFAVFADAGYKVSGPISASFGNLVFTEIGDGATTSAAISGSYLLNDPTPQPLGTALTRVVTTSTPGIYSAGYFGTSGALPLGEFNYFGFAGNLILSASGGVGAVILAQPQNHLTVSLVAMPVPEPETWALMLGGLLMVGQRLRRRTPR